MEEDIPALIPRKKPKPVEEDIPDLIPCKKPKPVEEKFISDSESEEEVVFSPPSPSQTISDNEDDDSRRPSIEWESSVASSMIEVSCCVRSILMIYLFIFIKHL